jgi:hypothetical protein
VKLSDLPERYQQQAIKQGAGSKRELDLPAKGRKYHNKPTVDSTGRLCDSALEARVSDRLRAGNEAVIPQISSPLSNRPNDRMIIDFLVIEERRENGRFVAYFADAKGLVTPEWRQKERRFEDAYGLTIIKITK